MNIWEILQVSGKRKRQRKGVIPILRVGCSIAPQRTGPAQGLGHVDDKATSKAPRRNPPPLASVARWLGH